MTNRSLTCSRSKRAKLGWRTSFGAGGLAAFASFASFAAFAAFAFVSLAPAKASAQEWLKDRRYEEGAGIRTGDFELHPGIGGEIGYDSNWFLRSHQQGAVNGPPNLAPVGAGVIRVTPSFSVSTIGQQRTDGVYQPSRIAFRGGVAATYREFIGDEDVRQQRNLSGNAFLRLDVNPNRPLGFAVFANYQRLIQPAVVANPDFAFNRSDVNAGAEIIAIPGGGTLDLRAGYQFFGAFFEQSNGVPLTNLTHELAVRNRWRFRPRTALFHDTTLRFIDYPYADRSINFLNSSTPLRTRLGINGLVTDRFGVLLAGGYGATFFKGADLPSTTQFDSFTAQAEGTFYLSQGAGQGEPGQATLLLSTLTFGFLRDFQNSLLANFYTSNKGYARMSYFFGGKTLLQLSGYFEGLSYPQPFYNQGGNPVPVTDRNGALTGDFTNFRAGGTFYSEYRFTDAFAINGTIDYAQMISDTTLNVLPAAGAGPGATGPEFFDLNWRRFQAFIGARWFL